MKQEALLAPPLLQVSSAVEYLKEHVPKVHVERAGANPAALLECMLLAGALPAWHACGLQLVLPLQALKWVAGP